MFMNAQDLGKALIGLFGGGLAFFLLFGAMTLNSPSNPTSLCLASTVAFFWFALVLYLSAELRKAGGDCVVPCPCFSTIFGFFLFWAFMAFALDQSGFFKSHHDMAPLGGVYFALSALLLYTYWLSTAPSKPSETCPH